MSILKCCSQALICEVAGLSKWFCSGVRKEHVSTSIVVIPTTLTSPFRWVYSGYDAGGLASFVILQYIFLKFTDKYINFTEDLQIHSSQNFGLMYEEISYSHLH